MFSLRNRLNCHFVIGCIIKAVRYVVHVVVTFLTLMFMSVNMTYMSLFWVNKTRRHATPDTSLRVQSLAADDERSACMLATLGLKFDTPILNGYFEPLPDGIVCFISIETVF